MFLVEVPNFCGLGFTYDGRRLDGLRFSVPVLTFPHLSEVVVIVDTARINIEHTDVFSANRSVFMIWLKFRKFWCNADESD